MKATRSRLIEASLNVENHNLSTRTVEKGISRKPGCSSCAVAQGVAYGTALSGATYVAEDVDENMVVIGGTDFAGFVVIPRQHINGLGELPALRQAQLLAALQRTTRTILQQHPGVTTKVMAMTYPPGSEGHTCFHVLPSVSDDTKRSFSMPA